MATPNKPSSFSFKALVACVPILDFCFYGMAGRWGADLANGRNETMPRRFVTSANFVSGFLYLVIALAIGIVAGIVNVVPLIGQLACFALAVLAPTISGVMFFRYLMFGSFSEAWNLKDIWEKSKRAFGSLFVATWIPAFVCGVASSVVFCLMLLAVIPVGLIPSFTTLALASQSALDASTVATFMFAFGFMMVGIAIASIFVAIISAIGTIWSMRALGYWVARYAPEWIGPHPPRQQRYQQQPRTPQPPVGGEAGYRQQEPQDPANRRPTQACYYHQGAHQREQSAPSNRPQAPQEPTSASSSCDAVDRSAPARDPFEPRDQWPIVEEEQVEISVEEAPAPTDPSHPTRIETTD